jgi:hypothetical protein
VIAGELASASDAVPGSDVEVAEHGPAPRSAHPTWNPEVVDGPLSTRALLRVDEALRLADASTGLTFSVYIGELGESSRETAELLHGRLTDPEFSVLVAISPNQRVLEIVTGSRARRRVLDRDAKLAAPVDVGGLRRRRPRWRRRRGSGPTRRPRRPQLAPFPR